MARNGHPMKPAPFHRILFTLCLLFVVTAMQAADVTVVLGPNTAPVERLAARDLADTLARLYPGDRFPLAAEVPAKGKAILLGQVSDKKVRAQLGSEVPTAPESYAVSSKEVGGQELAIIAGADARGVAYGVYGLLEKLGCWFTFSGDVVPKARAKHLSFKDWCLTNKPLIKDRLVFNWHNFLSGCSTWNLADWNHWTDQSQKMGYNAIMVHAYGNNPMVSYTYDGKAKPLGYLSTSNKGRDFGTTHVTDVRNLHGGGVFNSAVFGADAAQIPEEKRAEATRKLMQGVFAHAAERGMNVVFANDVDTISANPQEIIKSLPEKARIVTGVNHDFWLANPETEEGYRFYKTQLATLLADYPQITTLALWFRVHDTPLTDLKLTEMPAAWQGEYQEAIKRRPDIAKSAYAPRMLAVSKVVRAYERALKELGHDHIQLAGGGWAFDFLSSADVFFPPGIELIGKDYNVIHDRSAMERQRRSLAKVGEHRPVIPVIWAQHDDGKYVGRSFKPFADFQTKLLEAKASGFGIVHWTTRPHDLFFASHSRQLWQRTLNEPLRQTCDEMAARALGDIGLGEYLERWATDAPLFGRETTDDFIDPEKPLLNVDEVLKGCRERMALLGTADNNQVNYYRGLEKFIIMFFETHDALYRAKSAYKSNDLEQARQIMAQCHPEKVIEQYAKFSSLGGMTRGEQGVLATLNTRWLVYFDRMRQMLGMEPIRYNFGPTSHDVLAQAPGNFTYYFDAKHQVWQTLGTKETGAATFSTPSASDDIARQGLESDKPVTLTLRPIANKADLPSGQYRLRLLFADPDSTAEGERIFTVSVANGSPCTVDVFKEAGGAKKLVEQVYPVTLTAPGEIAVTLTPFKGKVVISGAVLEPVGFNK